MKRTINVYEFRDAFRDMERGNSFSYEGYQVLFDFLESYEDDTGQEIELDVIALCCEFNEDTPEEIAVNYDIDISECDDDEEIKETVLEYLNDNTMVCGDTDTTIVYQAF